MWHVGIDLHRATVVIAAVNDAGEAKGAVTIRCEGTAFIVETIRRLGTLRVVIEASGTYRWLYDLLRPYGTILLAHPLRLRAMIQRRFKTDKLDAQLLANLLRSPEAVIAWGWESREFYARWMHTDAPEMIRELQGPVLNLGSPQSSHAPALLDLVKKLFSKSCRIGQMR
ncbi:MAG: IS110 family transposase [Rhodopirellula sp.]|nr:IS110 family transposase [Rhodopirellula sp.]